MSHLAQRKIHTRQKNSGDQFKVGFVTILRFCLSVFVFLWYATFPYSLSHWWLWYFLYSVADWTITVYPFLYEAFIPFFSNFLHIQESLSADGWSKTLLVKILNTLSVPSKPTSDVWNSWLIFLSWILRSFDSESW